MPRLEKNRRTNNERKHAHVKRFDEFDSKDVKIKYKDDKTTEDLENVEGVGVVVAESIAAWFADEENKERLERLLSYLTIEKPQASQEEQKLAGLTFVITGSVEHFPNRNALKARIEELGGKATGSVTGKTSYLINNDTTSSSSKNRKARELGVPVISEEEFLKMTEE